jgi:hemolysin activation/secretion protein
VLLSDARGGFTLDFSAMAAGGCFAMVALVALAPLSLAWAQPAQVSERETLRLERKTNLNSLARARYPGSQATRDQFRRLMVQANPSLFKAGTSPGTTPLPAGTLLVMPANLPPLESPPQKAAERSSAAMAEPSPKTTPVAAESPVASASGNPTPPANGGGSLLFDITHYVAHGNTILSQEVLDGVLAPYTGPGRDFGTVQQALEALEKEYAARGFNAIQVLLPEQTLESGAVHFMVVESRLANIKVEGNRHFSSENYQRSLVSMEPGKTPNFDQMVDNLRLANENPAKQVSVVMRAGETEGAVDAVVRASDQAPIRYAVTFDNTGNEQTGPFRLGAAVQHANLFDRDQVISFQAITSPLRARQVRIYGLGYQAPIYSMGGSFGMFLGYSNVNSGTVNTVGGNFNIAGSGIILGLRYTHIVPKRSDWEHKLSFGWDWRAYQSNVTVVGGTAKLVPDVTVQPLSITWQGALKKPDSELSTYVSLVQNLPGGNDANDTQFQRIGARPGANAQYQIWRYGFNYQKALGADWTVRANLTGQHTRQSLVTGEMFGIGGADSVRGFLEREHSNDKGHRGSLELYSPDLGQRMYDGLRLRLLGFYDFGWVKRVHPTAQEVYSTGIASTGFGVRAGLGKTTTMRLDYAKVVDNSHTSRGMRLHGTLSYVF